jgi:outer membrane immunogenic protein
MQSGPKTASKVFEKMDGRFLACGGKADHLHMLNRPAYSISVSCCINRRADVGGRAAVGQTSLLPAMNARLPARKVSMIFASRRRVAKLPRSATNIHIAASELQPPQDDQSCHQHAVHAISNQKANKMRCVHFLSVPVGALAAMAAIPAVGADLPTKAPPVAPVYAPPPFNWTGFYIGGNVGGAWAQGNVVDTITGGSFGTNSNGAFIGGGQLGFNYQIGNAVFGVEGFFDGVASNNNNTTNILTGFTGDQFQATANATWIGTLAGRLGVTGPGFDHWLLYAKGGGAWVGYNATVSDLTSGMSASTSNSQGGWLAGAGIEWAFAPNWTAKLEYQYVGLNGFSVGGPFVADRFEVNSPNIQMVTFGINYLFHSGGSW